MFEIQSLRWGVVALGQSFPVLIPETPASVFNLFPKTRSRHRIPSKHPKVLSSLLHSCSHGGFLKQGKHVPKKSSIFFDGIVPSKPSISRGTPPSQDSPWPANCDHSRESMHGIPGSRRGNVWRVMGRAGGVLPASHWMVFGKIPSINA